MWSTRTQEGPWYFFHISYFLLNTATLLEKIHKPTGRRWRMYLQKRFAREIIINNSLGRFSVNPKNDSLTKSITSFEYNHQDWLAAASHTGIFIDIGANIGFYSILAAKQYDFSHIHAFEPNPDTYHRLQKNITLNNLTDKVTIHTVALGSEISHASLTAKRTHTGGSTLVPYNNNQSDSSVVDVPVTTYDHLSTEQHIPAQEIGFIKIDVEGYEYPVLQGMQDTLAQLRSGACLFIEIHPHAPNAPETKELIEEYGFKMVKSSPQKNFLYIKE